MNVEKKFCRLSFNLRREKAFLAKNLKNGINVMLVMCMRMWMGVCTFYAARHYPSP